MTLTLPRHRATLTLSAALRTVLPVRRHRAVPTVGNDPRPVRTGGVRLGQPPMQQRPGYWRPGTADEVRRAVTAAAADAALVRYCADPSDENHRALLAAQSTFRSVTA